MEYLGKTEKDRHSDSGEDGAGRVDQATEGVSAKDDFDSQCLDGKGQKSDEQQAQGSGLSPEGDVKASGKSHGKDGEDDHSPPQGGTDEPFRACRGTAGKSEHGTKRCRTSRDHLQQEISDGEQKQEKQGA
jgi:hypothetical protein